jgi:hypothetical protein
MIRGLALVLALATVETPEDVEPRAGTRAGARILERLERLEDDIEITRYQHRTVIRPGEGLYAFDCSAMVSWILKRTAPKARRALDRDRPVAATYAKVIRKAPTGRARDGWRRIAHIEDVRPGDVFAWKRPPDFPSKSTGHVGFVLRVPEPVPNVPGAYRVRIADATSLTHGNDTRDPEGDGGFGHGTILFMTDGQGQGTAYGWFGRARYLIETPIYFGRVSG